MAEPDLFDTENSALAHARGIYLDAGASAATYRATLGELIGHYERLMRETRRLIRRSDREELEMNRLNQRLQELAQELEYRATHDQLTGALNRGAVIERATAALDNGPVALIVLDIDHFKRLNDTFGHPVGDIVICEVTACLHHEMPAGGLLGRVGGEEFAALLPDTDCDIAIAMAERMRIRIAEHRFPPPLSGPVTASFGISCNARGTSFVNAYARADEALYDAKRAGRNRVVCADGRTSGSNEN
ncbi:GGDEF domain-containing protein [Cupriavidus plantarum]|uniref:GGDEF domain-containing protein n=1 Tax=Cupriavidus plantarum TaxID=942865 RepID=UPI00339DA569